jgi:hypothetical protein
MGKVNIVLSEEQALECFEIIRQRTEYNKDCIKGVEHQIELLKIKDEIELALDRLHLTSKNKSAFRVITLKVGRMIARVRLRVLAKINMILESRRIGRMCVGHQTTIVNYSKLIQLYEGKKLKNIDNNTLSYVRF